MTSCQRPSGSDMIIVNARVYTVNPDNEWAQGVAIEDGLITAVGSEDEIRGMAWEETEIVDAQGNFVMPGFIEGHGHFSGLGSGLQNLNFLRSRSWQEIVDAVAKAAKEAEPGEWIIGRGWHQEKWQDTLMDNVLGYPYHDALSAVSPDNPVMLSHASGHGLFANKSAMDLAGVTAETANPSGGNIVRDAHGKAVGVFEENAMSIVRDAYRQYLNTLSADELLQQWYDGIALAEEECLSKGVTSFQDAGCSLDEAMRYREMAENGELDLRLWSMIRHEHEYLKDRVDQLPILDAGDGFFTSRAIKLTIDGALGSYGAWLLEPYADNPGFYGQNTSNIEQMDALAQLCAGNELQFCVHAIGDRANREVLDAFERALASPEALSAARWRIEHSQHIHPDDIPRFGQLGVIASMQGIHCTSDAPFVEKRLGFERARNGAYVWQSLLQSGAVVTNGTDAPVEDVSPIESFYASVTRKKPGMDVDFFPAQSMSRAEAIYSYTMANAYAAFEEETKGSLEIGKYADIIILSQDLMNCEDEDIIDAEVLMTIVNGVVKHQSSSLE